MNQIVFVSVDCLRADHLGCYGYDRPVSPHIDEIAANGTVFEHSYSNCPGTRWAFQSLHTGVSTLQIEGLGIPEDYRPLAAFFSEEGYATGGFAVNGFVSRDYRYNVGFDTYYSVQESSTQQSLLQRTGRKINDVLDSEFVRDHLLKPVRDRLQAYNTDDDIEFRPEHTDSDTVDHALSFIEDHRDEPYFLWVHLMDAHTPYGYWPDHLDALRGDTDINHTISPGDEGLIEYGTKPPQNVIDTYDAGIRSADEQIGRLLEEIPRKSTVVITGDHGEEFGRFGDFHEASLYSSMTQVPIIVRDSDLGRGRSEMPVQHLDIPPTLLYAAGVDIPEHWEGEPVQTADRTSRYPIIHVLGEDEIAVRVGDWKYIESEGTEELYHVPHSGTEDEPTNDPQMRQKLRSIADKYRTKGGRVGIGQSELGEDDTLSENVERNLEDLGYI